MSMLLCLYSICEMYVSIEVLFKYGNSVGKWDIICKSWDNNTHLGVFCTMFSI